MGGESVTVVYVDLLFLLNFVANYLLLLGAGRMSGAVLRRGRIAGGAALGAGYAAAVFLPGLGWLSAWPCKLASGVLMVLAAYGAGRELLRTGVLFFAASAALAGGVLAVELLGGTSLTVANGVFYSHVDLRLLLLLFLLSYFILSLFFRRLGRHTQRELARVRVGMQGREIGMTALLDSGYTLADPVTNRPVIVADSGCFAGLLPPEVREAEPIQALRRCQEMGIRGARLIPYRAVGVECGLLLALRADWVSVGGTVREGILVALSHTPVGAGAGYQALVSTAWSAGAAQTPDGAHTGLKERKEAAAGREEWK